VDHVCRACSTKRKVKWEKENDEAHFNHYLKARFGINRSQYYDMLESQNGTCAICNKPETRKHHKSGRIIRLAVDHCHITGKIRGLLCAAHNKALGTFKDDVSILENAINYLKKHSS
jgi:hypothetical protein